MWFKNLIAYRFTGPFNHQENTFEEKLVQKAFTPCSSQELSSYGWTAPCAELDDQLLCSVNGFFLVCAQKEEKMLPTSVIRSQVQEKVNLIEQEQARKVYRKERDQIKDEIILDLLPRAFSRFKRTYALIAPSQGWVFVDSSSHKPAEELLSHLRTTLGSLPVALPDVKHSPSAIMSHWLEDDKNIPAAFTVLDETELKDNLVEGGVIRIKGQEIQSDEFIAHLEAGKRVSKLSVEWDEHLRMLLCEDLSVKRIKLTDQMKEEMDQEADDDAIAQFYADTVQMGLEFSRLMPALFEAYGGMVTEET